MSYNENGFSREFYDDNIVGETNKKNNGFKVPDDNEFYSNDNHSNISNDYYTYDDYKKPKKKKWKKALLVTFLVLLGLIVLLFLFGFIMSKTLPAKTHVLIMATDEDGTRTDTLMLATFDKNSKDISIVSIPRDTYITVSDESYSLMCEEYPEPGSSSMKINTVHHFGGKKYGTKLICKEVEKLFDIKLEYYVKIDFEAFRYIVDYVGGVDFYVPQNMEYHDPYQDLHISLVEGQQKLNGEQAEQLVRFRSGYANGDLGRVDVQQEFLKALVSKVLSKNTIISYPGMFWNILYKYDFVQTDASFFDVFPYIFVVGGLDTENIQTITLPGESGYAAGQSVYFANESECQTLIDEYIK